MKAYRPANICALYGLPKRRFIYLYDKKIIQPDIRSDVKRGEFRLYSPEMAFRAGFMVEFEKLGFDLATSEAITNLAMCSVREILFSPNNHDFWLLIAGKNYPAALASTEASEYFKAPAEFRNFNREDFYQFVLYDLTEVFFHKKLVDTALSYTGVRAISFVNVSEVVFKIVDTLNIDDEDYHEITFTYSAKRYQEKLKSLKSGKSRKAADAPMQRAKTRKTKKGNRSK